MRVNRTNVYIVKNKRCIYRSVNAMQNRDVVIEVIWILGLVPCTYC